MFGILESRATAADSTRPCVRETLALVCVACLSGLLWVPLIGCVNRANSPRALEDASGAAHPEALGRVAAGQLADQQAEADTLAAGRPVLEFPPGSSVRGGLWDFADESPSACRSALVPLIEDGRVVGEYRAYEMASGRWRLSSVLSRPTELRRYWAALRRLRAHLGNTGFKSKVIRPQGVWSWALVLGRSETRTAGVFLLVEDLTDTGAGDAVRPPRDGQVVDEQTGLAWAHRLSEAR